MNIVHMVISAAIYQWKHETAKDRPWRNGLAVPGASWCFRSFGDCSATTTTKWPAEQDSRTTTVTMTLP